MTRFAVIDNLLTAFSGATLTRFNVSSMNLSLPASLSSKAREEEQKNHGFTPLSL
ncbi:hypothetical protein NIES4103_60050 [Nostoc sp. NIES-4103]|nr:hypothetical protein NIES4103_60050 [Nostoc sp. NIES-4103]